MIESYGEQRQRMPFRSPEKFEEILPRSTKCSQVYAALVSISLIRTHSCYVTHRIEEMRSFWSAASLTKNEDAFLQL